MLEAEGPECFPRLSTVGREKTKSLFVPCEIKEKDEKLHTLFIQNKGELLEAAAASPTALNGVLRFETNRLKECSAGRSF